jgi:hypothetical protein
MQSMIIKYLILFQIVFVFFGCANIPQESVTLSQEVSAGIRSIHESNIRFVNQYFNRKKEQILELKVTAIHNFFNDVIAGTTRSSAPPIDGAALHSIKDQLAKISAKSDEHTKALEVTRLLVIEKLQQNFNVLLDANSTITGLLQSAVDVDKSKNEGLSKIKELSGGKVDLLSIESEMDSFLSKIGSKAADGTSLINAVKGIISN